MRVINPDSVVLQQLDGQWQKLAALIVWKLVGRDKIVRITGADIEALAKEFAPSGPLIFTHGLHDGFEFSVISGERADAIAAHDRTQRGTG